MSDGVGSQRPLGDHGKTHSARFRPKGARTAGGKTIGGGGNEPAALHPGGGGGIAPSSPPPYSSAMRFSAMPLSFAVSMMAR